MKIFPSVKKTIFLHIFGQKKFIFTNSKSVSDLAKSMFINTKGLALIVMQIELHDLWGEENGGTKKLLKN